MKFLDSIQKRKPKHYFYGQIVYNCAEWPQEERRAISLKPLLKSMVVVALIIGINWAGLWAVGRTFGFFSDTENSSGNFAAGTLNFELESPGDFAPVCSIDGGAERTINIINNDNPFKYVASSTEFSGDVCNYVNLEANLDGGEAEYVGPLNNFNIGIFEFSDPESWVFNASTSLNLPANLQGQTCTFKFIFNGSQTRNDLPFGEGFTDSEEITNNIKAPVCHYSQTLSKGYWKNHPEAYDPALLPQTLGGIGSEDLSIDNQTEVNKVFDDYELSMRNKLRGQLLAMKFNIADFGVGDYFVVSEGKTLNEIVTEADALLNQNPPPANSVLENMKNLVEYWNQDRQLRICSCGQGGPENPKIVINKVYYDVDTAHGTEPANEWIELYNPGEEPINITDWTIEDNTSPDLITSSSPIIIPPLGFAIITGNASTWGYWNIPDNVLRIVLADGDIGDGLDNLGDRVVLKDIEGNIVDMMSYGSDIFAFDPSVTVAPEGDMLARFPNGTDTDTAADWRDFSPPSLTIINPVGGEVWYVGHTYNLQWTATNPNGLDTDLKIDIYYSADSGHTWAPVIENTANDGSYHWSVSLFLEPGHYYVPSPHARIKIIATGPENFMVQGEISSRDFCPPIDYDSLSPEDQQLVDQLIADGVIDESEVIRGGVDKQGQASAQEPVQENISPSTETATSSDENIIEAPKTDTGGGGQPVEVFEPAPSPEETAVVEELPITPQETTNVENSPIEQTEAPAQVPIETQISDEQPAVEQQPIIAPENNPSPDSAPPDAGGSGSGDGGGSGSGSGFGADSGSAAPTE